MLTVLLAQAAQQVGTAPFDRPAVDWHALAPEIVVVATAVVILLVDVIALEDGRRYMPTLCGLGLLGACIPIVTLAVDGSTRVLFGGAYVVDRTSLILKVLLLLSGYVVVLLSTNFVAEGDYWESEYYLMLLSSIAGMVVMCSAQDFVTIFVALELLSLPAYMLATWNKRDARSNEAGLKYYLMGVFASAADAVRHVAALRRERDDDPRQDGAGPGRRHQLDADHHAGHRAHHRRLRLQGLRGAVPHLGARHLRGRARPRSRRSCRCCPRPPGSWRCCSSSASASSAGPT